MSYGSYLLSRLIITIFFSPDLPCSSLGPLEGKDYNINKGKLYFGWEKMLKKLVKRFCQKNCYKKW